MAEKQTAHSDGWLIRISRNICWWRCDQGEKSNRGDKAPGKPSPDWPAGAGGECSMVSRTRWAWSRTNPGPAESKQEISTMISFCFHPLLLVWVLPFAASDQKAKSGGPQVTTEGPNLPTREKGAERTECSPEPNRGREWECICKKNERRFTRVDKVNTENTEWIKTG